MIDKIEIFQIYENEIEAMTREIQKKAKEIRTRQLKIWNTLEGEDTDSLIEQTIKEVTLNLLKRRINQTKNIMNWENIPAEFN